MSIVGPGVAGCAIYSLQQARLLPCFQVAPFQGYQAQDMYSDCTAESLTKGKLQNDIPLPPLLLWDAFSLIQQASKRECMVGSHDQPRLKLS